MRDLTGGAAVVVGPPVLRKGEGWHEEWRPVVGYEGVYEVSDLGHVRSLDRVVVTSTGKVNHYKGRLLRATPRRDINRRNVHLSHDGKKQVARVAHLVAAAFLGPRPEGMHVCHNDGDSTNDALSNLRYDTRSNNTLDSVRHGTHHWTEVGKRKREAA